MIKRLFVLALAIATLTYSTPVQASAPARPPGSKGGPVVISVTVTNDSSTCVWVSVAYATFYTPWSWMHEPHNIARFIRPRESYKFTQGTVNPLPIPHPFEVKVEGTFMTNSDCTGVHEREIWEVNKGIIANENYGTIANASASLRGDSKASYHILGPFQGARR